MVATNAGRMTRGAPTGPGPEVGRFVLGLVYGCPAAMARPFLDSLRCEAAEPDLLLATREFSAEPRVGLLGLACRLLPYRHHRQTVVGH